DHGPTGSYRCGGCRPCRRRHLCRAAFGRARRRCRCRRVGRLPGAHRDAPAGCPQRQALGGQPVVRPPAPDRPRRHAAQRRLDARGVRRDPAWPVRRAHLGPPRSLGAPAGGRPRRARARPPPGDDVHRHRARPAAAPRLLLRRHRRRALHRGDGADHRRRPRRAARLGARGQAVAVPRRARPRCEPPGHAGLAGDGAAPGVRRHRPRGHAAPAAHRSARQRARHGQRSPDRPDRPGRRRDGARAPRGDRCDPARHPSVVRRSRPGDREHSCHGRPAAADPRRQAHRDPQRRLGEGHRV
ncbi:MAG: Ketopantoate reductase PanG, partial [uncultured Nocardioidaceae bacterium]